VPKTTDIGIQLGILAGAGVRPIVVPLVYSSRRSILNPQTHHALEFAGVIGDEDQVARLGQDGDEHVVGADGRSGGGEGGADFAGRRGRLTPSAAFRGCGPSSGFCGRRNRVHKRRWPGRRYRPRGIGGLAPSVPPASGRSSVFQQLPFRDGWRFCTTHGADYGSKRRVIHNILIKGLDVPQTGYYRSRISTALFARGAGLSPASPVHPVP